MSVERLFEGMAKPSEAKPVRRVTLLQVLGVAWRAWKKARAMSRDELARADANAAFNLQDVADLVLAPAAKRVLGNLGADLFEIGDTRSEDSKPE